MVKHTKALLIAGLLAICYLSGAQNIGVQANLNLVPPYTLSLHDYTQPGSNKLTATVLLKDLNILTYQVKLRFTIAGNGFTLTTRPDYLPGPITLQGGIPAILGPTELEAYFQPENLIFDGLNKADYIRTRKLPEGFYQFFMEVLDYNRSSVVSNKAMAMAFIVLNEPPIINLPLNNSKLPANDPQNIMFNWSPRHLGSPNSAFTTLYEFRLYEILPKGRDPYEAVRTTYPIYEAIPPLTTTSFNYNVIMPALIPGREYAFTVRAVDREGRDLFKNNGYSQVSKFTWGDECKPPTGIEAQAVTGGGMELKWQTTPAHTGFNIHYRTKGSSSWYLENSLIDNASIYDLPGNTEIEYQVQSVCGGYESEYSQIYSLTTLPEDPSNFSCGAGKGLAAITNNNPKKSLKEGDRFKAGGYTAIITKVSGQDGTFSGECNVVVPFFKLAKVPHKFENIKINELNQMYEGKLVSIYNPNSPWLVRVEGKEKEVEVEPEPEKKPQVASNATGANNNDTANHTINVEGEIKEVHTNSTGQLVIVNSSGDSTVVNSGSSGPATITDSNGNQYVADKGNVTKTENKANSTGTGNSSGTGESTKETANFHVQQDILKIGYGQNIPVTFAIFHDLKDITNASVKLGVTDPVFTKTSDIASLEDKDPKTGQPAPTIGDKFYHMTWIPKLEMETFPQPGNHTLTFDLLRNNNQLAEQKLQIEVLPKYELMGLTATDANNTKRVAKAGETLYLVAKNNVLPNRKIIYNCTSTSPNGSYWPGEPYWKIDEKIQAFTGKKYEVTTKNWPTLENFSSPGKNTVEAFAYDKSYSVNIEWLRENKQTSTIVPFNMKPKLDKLTKIGETLTSQINKLGKYFSKAGINATTEIKFGNLSYNKEDINSRLYKKVQDATVSYGAKLETSDLPIPGISTPAVLSKFITIGAFWSIKVEGRFQVNLVYEGLCTSQTLSYSGAKTSGLLEGQLKLGLKFSILPTIKDYVNIEAKGYATVGIQGLMEIQMPKEQDIYWKIQARTAPVVLGWSATVKLVDWELVDYKSEVAVCDSYNLGCVGTACTSSNQE